MAKTSVAGAPLPDDSVEILDKDELIRFQKREVAKAARMNGYPSIGDQLDMQYWDKKNGTTNWEEAVAKTKTDFPKGADEGFPEDSSKVPAGHDTGDGPISYGDSE